MDSTQEYMNPSPQASANFLSKIFFWWLIPFFKYGYQNNLKPSDIYNALDHDKCENVVKDLEKNWEHELKLNKGDKNQHSLKRAILKTFVKQYSYSGFYIFVQAIILKSLQPLVLAEYIRYFDTSQKYDRFGEYSGWILGAANVAIAFVYALLYHHGLLSSQQIGMRVRVACSSLVYRKMLKLSQISLNKTPAGKLVNLLSNDLQRFDICSMYLHYIWIMPLQAAVCFYILFQNIGISATAGFLAMVIEAIPVQGYMSKLQGVLRSKIAEKTDFRIRLMNELVSGIKVIKMYAWEKYFAKVVENARNEEVDKIFKTSKFKGVSMAFIVVTERFALFCSLIAFVLLGNRLTAEKVFSCAQLYNSLQQYMCFMFVCATVSYAEAIVSLKRIEEFLLMEENDPPAAVEDMEDRKGNILVDKFSGTWNNSNEETLKDISFDIKPGTLCCVVGSVGSGKTSLLQMILRELPLMSGKLEVCGKLSYASQEPWLFVSSVRQNILFGQPYERERYNRVVQVCALETDLKQFQFGDKTLVEERGVSLSGGQRARINLARSVYSEADIYLLDDPLSAVDTKVGKHLFQRCIKGYLRNKTRILVTHQVQFLKEADLIIIIEAGKIHKMGRYDELSEEDFKKLHHEIDENEPQTEPRRQSLMQKQIEKNVELLQRLSIIDTGPEQQSEEMATGSIPFSTYKRYFAYGTGLCGFMIMVLLIILAQAACNAGDLWITNWVNHENEIYNLTVYDTPEFAPIDDTKSNITDNFPFNYTIVVDDYSKELIQADSEQDKYMYIYSILIASALILTPICSINFYRIIMNASRNLHNKMFSNVLEAPMKFFDTNSSGRILSRFSNDMGIIDEQLPKAYLEATQILMVLFGILIMVFLKVPWMMLPAFILSFGFYYARVIFLKTSQDVKRLEGVNRAPVFSHLITSKEGITTIRASKVEEMVIKEFDILLDQHSGTWYLYKAACEVFGFIMDCISTLFIAFVTFQFLIFNSGSDVTGSVGLTISQCLILTGMLQLGVRQTAEVANNMTSVERVLQYTNLEKETDKENKSELTPKDILPKYKPLKTTEWPENGEIKFKNVYLRYDPEDDPVLNDLNLVIKPGWKVGVVGRTGAGKSTLIAALFRLAPVEGSIIIDGVDTTTLKLSELRSKISIIPQEPVLFSATVRHNLDPFGTVTDDELWKALENVELKKSIENLDNEIQEGGSNFSTGQRQLLCLARAIVRRNKILVLDEATANVDPSTDALIQNTIRQNFKHCTVITIAHRLNTIMDSDRVLVMNAGKAVEFAHPHVLLKNSEGIFSGMLKETGAATEAALRKIAEEHYSHLFFDELKT